MTTIIKGDNCLIAWQNACDFLKRNGKKHFNLILEIKSPTEFNDLDLWVEQRNPNNINGGDNIFDVINTIFPYKFHERNSPIDRHSFYEEYKELYLRGKRIKPRQSWGTYFQRLINFSNHFNNLNSVNQIENAILALSQNRVRRNAIVFHPTSPSIDSNTRIIGGPCWQFGEILWSRTNNEISLLVVYRNHDYFNKVLGNLIGLSKLLNFLCVESGKNPGTLIVHSANAYYDCSNDTLDKITR